MRSMYETERTLNEASSFILQLKIDQKSMPTSNKKRDLKTRLQEYNTKYYALEAKFKKLQLGFKDQETPTPDDDDLQLTDHLNLDSDESEDDEMDKSLLETSCEMEFSTSFDLNDKEMQVEGGPKKRGKMRSVDKQIQKQNEMIQKALKMGMKTHELSQ